ncbi:MAG TPA: DNA-primase RepB domain-containing protein [Guyparkeria sp.]|nr:DNA-primase RepB domain-containing protein [Guyparkeria sp.]
MSEQQRHTSRFLAWFSTASVRYVDFAVGRRSGDDLTWIIPDGNRCVPIADLARRLAWARHENNSDGDVYIRPSAKDPAGLVFLDDVSLKTSCGILKKYNSIAVRTSEAGGCHVWIQTSQPLSRDERGAVQRQLQPLAGSDPLSTAGDKWGRLPGYANHKRGGEPVEVLNASVDIQRLDVGPYLSGTAPPAVARDSAPQPASAAPAAGTGQVDRSRSGEDWQYALRAALRGRSYDEIYPEVLARAHARKKRRPEHYARVTSERAVERAQQWKGG